MDNEMKKILLCSWLFFVSTFGLIYLFYYTTSGSSPDWTYKSLKFSEVSADSPAIIQNDIVYFCSGPRIATYDAGRTVFLNAVRKDGTALWSTPVQRQCNELNITGNKIYVGQTGPAGLKGPVYKENVILNGRALIIDLSNGHILETLPSHRYSPEPFSKIRQLKLRHSKTQDLNAELFTPKHIFVTDKKTGKIILDFGATGNIHGFIEDSDSLFVYDDDGKLYMFRK